MNVRNFRERLLLWREGESSLRNREIITTIISHELAHIWFGNLVSPKWWDHLWFNEGFASFFELRIPSLSNPQWRLAERSVTDDQLAAMITDSLESTRAMNNPVGSPSSVMASFDTIAYSKSKFSIKNSKSKLQCHDVELYSSVHLQFLKKDFVKKASRHLPSISYTH